MPKHIVSVKFESTEPEVADTERLRNGKVWMDIKTAFFKLLLLS